MDVEVSCTDVPPRVFCNCLALSGHLNQQCRQWVLCQWWHRVTVRLPPWLTQCHPVLSRSRVQDGGRNEAQSQDVRKQHETVSPAVHAMARYTYCAARKL